MSKIEDRLRYDKDATRLLIGFKDYADPIIDIFAPQIPVPKSGQFAQYPQGNFKFVGDTTRGVGDPNVKQLIIPGATWTPYFLEEHPLFDSVDRQVKERSGIVQNLIETSIVKKGRQIKNALDQERCKKVVDAVLASTYSTTITTKWDDTGGDPVADLKAAKKAHYANCGMDANYLMIPSLVFMAMGDVVRTKYGVTSNEAVRATIETILLGQLGIPATNLLISGAPLFGTTTYSQWWGDNVVLFYAQKAPIDQDATYMATLTPDDVPYYRQLPVYTDTHQTGEFVQGIMEYKVMFIVEKCGYVLKDCLL